MEDLEDSELQSILEDYFHLGYENKVIIEFLYKQHGIVFSLSTLKRRLRDYGLKRRGTQIDQEHLKNLIRSEISGPGELRGYRSVWHSLRLNQHIHVPRQRVAEIIREIDPQGTQQRRSRRLKRRSYSSQGPNFCWHVDGYDKLKPYGFPIHGAIDGYSRKMLWLEVSRTNNKPEVIGRFFLSCVKETTGCPMLLRTDCGTENGTMAAMQSFFRQDGTDDLAGEKAHRYGTSPANQRIECWWSCLRRGRTSWWIDLFKGMSHSGELDLASKLHLECLWFCYHSVLQEDLDKVKYHWNTHRIRPSRFGTVSGIPDVLYYLPHTSGGIDCKVTVPDDKIDEMEIHVQDDDDDNDSDIYQEYFHYVMESERFQYPNNCNEAYNLFQNLIVIANSH